MTRPLRAILYAAVSTPGQYHDEVSVPDQLAQGRALCATRGWPVMGEVVIPGFSRNYDFLDELRADCPEYDAFVRKIDASAMDVIVARDYDRLWRTAALQSQVSARCRRSGVQIYSLNQPVEPEDPALLDRSLNDARLVMEAMGGVFAEIDNRTRVRRMRAGKVARVASKGLHINGQCPYGYRYGAHGQPMEVCEEEAYWVRYVFRRRLEGCSIKGLTRELGDMGVPAPGGGGVWWFNAVYHMLANPVYYGAVRWSDQLNPEGAHEPLVSRADWEAVQDLRGRLFPRHVPEPDPIRDELVGLVYCGHCGHPLSIRRNKRKSKAKKRPPKVVQPIYSISCDGPYKRPPHCDTAHWHQVRDVLAWLIPMVQEELQDPEAFLASGQERSRAVLADQLGAVESQAKALQVQRNRWDAAYRTGVIDLEAFAQGRDEMNRQLVALSTEAERLRGRLAIWDGRRADLAEMEDMLGDLPRLPPEARRQVWLKLIHRIILRKGSPAHWEVIFR